MTTITEMLEEVPVRYRVTAKCDTPGCLMSYEVYASDTFESVVDLLTALGMQVVTDPDLKVILTTTCSAHVKDKHEI